MTTYWNTISRLTLRACDFLIHGLVMFIVSEIPPVKESPIFNFNILRVIEYNTYNSCVTIAPVDTTMEARSIVGRIGFFHILKKKWEASS